MKDLALSLRVAILITTLLEVSIARPQGNYYSTPQLAYYPHDYPNYYQSPYQPAYQPAYQPYNYQPFYPNSDYYSQPAYDYDLNFPYQLGQPNYPHQFDLGYQQYDQLNEIPEIKSPIQILPSQFPPRVEQLVERIQNYFSTYTNAAGQQTAGVETTTQGNRIGNSTEVTGSTTEAETEESTTLEVTTETLNDVEEQTTELPEDETTTTTDK